MPDEFKTLLEKSEKHALQNKFKLNPKKEIVEGIIKGLIANKKEHGEYYCPCRVQHTKETICPCAFHKAEIKRDGKCLCGLFVGKKEE